jgi:hypothetical protein
LGGADDACRCQQRSGNPNKRLQHLMHPRSPKLTDRLSKFASAKWFEPPSVVPSHYNAIANAQINQ